MLLGNSDSSGVRGRDLDFRKTVLENVYVIFTP